MVYAKRKMSKSKPKRIYKRKYRTKRSYKSKYSTSVQRALGFSRSQLVKLRYVQQIQLNPATAAGSTANVIYSANSIFLPTNSFSSNVSFSTSHQPLAFDQWAAIYNHYLVLGSKIKCQLIPNNSASPLLAGGICSIMVQDTNAAVTTATTVAESGRASYRQVAPNGTSPLFLSKSFSPKKFFKVKDLMDNIDNYGAPVTTNPTEQAYFALQFFPIDPTASSVIGPLVLVTLDYTVLFTGPKDLSQS